MRSSGTHTGSLPIRKSRKLPLGSLESIWKGFPPLLLQIRIVTVQMPVSRISGILLFCYAHAHAGLHMVLDARTVADHQGMVRRMLPPHGSLSASVQDLSQCHLCHIDIAVAHRHHAQIASSWSLFPPAANLAMALAAVDLEACPPVLEYTSVSSTSRLISRPLAST